MLRALLHHGTEGHIVGSTLQHCAISRGTCAWCHALPCQPPTRQALACSVWARCCSDTANEELSLPAERTWAPKRLGGLLHKAPAPSWPQSSSASDPPQPPLGACSGMAAPWSGDCGRNAALQTSAAASKDSISNTMNVASAVSRMQLWQSCWWTIE